ncbi:ester cyclase [Jannaschia pohangensis]|uniref:SnoaL-like polyketide cyclase n=1 Tax=Jannaschia pohangensis TaxID=390807 RepID=A0A1I3J8J2_9RHOB|nr:ester cyclase [Jannaschia pohangensis]SFI56406.1 SnoaL-like polyketide cyclase [Jannaschia pohangensis]
MRPDDTAFRRSALTLLADLARGDTTVIAPDATADAAAPFGQLDARGIAILFADLQRALPDLERRDDILLAGRNHDDARWQRPRAPVMVATTGSYVGTFRAPFAGIPPTGGVVTLTYGEAHHIVDGKLRQSFLLWDIAGLMMQAGCWPMAAPLGRPGLWPGPKGGAGLRLEPGDDSASLARVLAMHDALHAFDGHSIESMPMDAWAEDFMYYAAGNIGACRGLSGFRAHHQIPFLRAFPDRKGAGHFVRLSDGPFAVTGGDVALTHTGADYMGIPATGRALRMRVMDFYRFDDEGKIAENWLPNDTIGLMAQMGVDVMARMHHLTGDAPLTL